MKIVRWSNQFLSIFCIRAVSWFLLSVVNLSKNCSWYCGRRFWLSCCWLQKKSCLYHVAFVYSSQRSERRFSSSQSTNCYTLIWIYILFYKSHAHNFLEKLLQVLINQKRFEGIAGRWLSLRCERNETSNKWRPENESSSPGTLFSEGVEMKLNLLSHKLNLLLWTSWVKKRFQSHFWSKSIKDFKIHLSLPFLSVSQAS